MTRMDGFDQIRLDKENEDMRRAAARTVPGWALALRQIGVAAMAAHYAERRNG